MATRVVDWSLTFEPYWDRVPAAWPLLEGIAHDPGDRSRRLILADLLEEHGEADRAEFIRLQVAEMSGPYYEWQNTGSLREKALIDANRARWLEGLPEVPGLDWGNPLHFLGGLLERLILDGALFARHVETLVGRFDLRNLHLTGAFAEEVSLPASDLYARLCHLTAFSLNIGDEGLVRLLQSLRHPNLVALNVGACRLTPVGMATLAAAQALGGLSSLYLGYNDVGDEGLAVLAGSPNLRQLVSLNLEKSHIGDEGLVALARSPVAIRLEELDLHCNQVGDEGAIALAESPHLTRLRRLTLGENSIGPAGARALGASVTLTRLETLFIETNPIGLEGAEALGRRLGEPDHLNLFASNLDDEDAAQLALRAPDPALRLLALGANQITPAGLQALAASPYLSTLESLDLNQNPLGDAGAMHLAASPHLGRLTYLNLFGTRLTAAGLRTLASATWLRGLMTLNLSMNPLGDAGCAAVGELIRQCPALTQLDLGQTHVGASGIQALAVSPGLAALHWLDLNQNPLGDAGAVALAGSPHLTRLVTLNLWSIQVGVEGVRALLTSPHLSALQSLTLGGNPALDNEAAQALAGLPVPASLRTLNLHHCAIDEQGRRILQEYFGPRGVQVQV